MLLEPNAIYRDLIIDRLDRIEVETAVVGSASEIKGRLKVIEEHGGAAQIVVVSQEAILEPKNRWREFSDGSLKKPVSWLVLGNGDEESNGLRKRSRLLQGHTTFMQKPFTNFQFYYALNTSMQQDGNDRNLPEIDVDATDFTLSKASRGKILLVEDNLANQKFASLLLSKMGYRSDIAEDGREAIRLWRECEYDLILMDCLLPSMDGYAATSEIRQQENNHGRIPIIALTANASKRDREKCHQAGMDEVLTKPYRKQELADLLDRWLSGEPSFITIKHNLGQVGA
jgi:CheY-like chemotaxis protein